MCLYIQHLLPNILNECGMWIVEAINEYKLCGLYLSDLWFYPPTRNNADPLCPSWCPKSIKMWLVIFDGCLFLDMIVTWLWLVTVGKQATQQRALQESGKSDKLELELTPKRQSTTRTGDVFAQLLIYFPSTSVVASILIVVTIQSSKHGECEMSVLSVPFLLIRFSVEGLKYASWLPCLQQH